MTDATSEQLKARAARDREAVLTRLADARGVIIGAVAAATCALAAFIAATSPARSSVRPTHTPTPVSPFLYGGGGWWSGVGPTAPSTGSGAGVTTSGGS